MGDYTAAAIASMAFDLPHAVVDGNVYRVLSRYFGIDTPIDSTQGKRLFSVMAQEMMVPGHSADYNQAIMDFGAIQCTPKSPQCATCPLADSCQAYADGTVDSLPVKQHVTRVRNRYFTYFYVRCGGQTLLQRRADGDIWQGLYQPPMFETSRPMTLAEVSARVGEYGSPVLLREGFVHQLTHQRLHADFYLLEASARPEWEGLWIKESERDQYAVPRLVEEMFKLIPVS